MLKADIQIYLAEALDQEACKPTLTQALLSRVTELKALNIDHTTIINCLDDLCEDPYQINVDVIEDVIESIVIATL